MRRIAGLDELRGIGILVVMLTHFVDAFLPTHRFHEPIVFEQPVVRVDAGTGVSTVTANIAGPTEPRFDGTVELTGWATDHSARQGSGVASVEVLVNGEGIGKAIYGAAVPKAPYEFDERPPDSRWSIDWNVSATPPGPVLIESVVTTESGTEARFARPATFLGPSRWPWDARWLLAAATALLDLFFIISGFVITLVIVRTHGRPGFLRLFYARRSARILPLAVVVVAVSAALFPEGRWLAPGYLFFYSNYQTVFVRTTMPLVGVMWSLAVEEQYYLLVPLLAILVPKHRAWLIVGGLTVLGFTASRFDRILVIDQIYVNDIRTHVRAYYFGFGAWMALVQAGVVPRPAVWAWAFVGWAALLIVGFGGYLEAFEAPIVVCIVGLVWLAVSGRAALSVPVLRFFGIRCYGLYLLHMFVLAAIYYGLPGVGAVPAALVFAAGTLLLAEVSFRYFERPFLSLVPSSAAEAKAPVEARAGSPG
jgi:peptidoglycan/LPS O-acetylase OafA/YrhL